MSELVPPSADHFAASRTLMVDGQLRPAQVSDPRIVLAMRELPRERFVPADAATLAYADRAVPLGGGRFLLEPRVLARLVQLAAPLPGERALVVAANAGFGAALLARLGVAVDAVEPDPGLRARAEAALADPAVRAPVRFLDADAGGLPSASDAAVPAGGYPLVLVDGAVEVLDALARLVSPGGGRLVAVLNEPGRRPGRAILAERSGGRLAPKVLFDASSPTVPGFAAAHGFRL